MDDVEFYTKLKILTDARIKDLKWEDIDKEIDSRLKEAQKNLCPICKEGKQEFIFKSSNGAKRIVVCEPCYIKQR